MEQGNLLDEETKNLKVVQGIHKWTQKGDMKQPFFQDEKYCEWKV